MAWYYTMILGLASSHIPGWVNESVFLWIAAHSHQKIVSNLVKYFN